MRLGALSLHVILIYNFNMAKAARQSVMKRLAGWFDEHGWVQGAPDPKLRKALKATYKRGYEIRLSARPGELAKLQRLLVRAGFKPGKHFPKATRLVVPLYGKEQVQRFLKEIRRAGSRRRRSSGRK